MKFKEILIHKNKEQCLIIENSDEDYYIVYGTKFRLVEYGDLYSFIYSFTSGKVGWNFVKRRIKHDLYDNHKAKNDWESIDGTTKDLEIDVISLFIDGKKIEI